MKPVLGVNNTFELENGDCLVDVKDPKLMIQAPEIVREICLKGGKMKYQGGQISVEVEAENIEEAVKKCRPEA